MDEFPKMIYRPRLLPNPELGGQKLDYLIVNSVSEQAVAVKDGWSVEFADACVRVEKTENRRARISALRTRYGEWEWVLKAIATLLVLAAGVIAFIKVL